MPAPHGLTPGERTARARKASLTRWGNTDPAEASAAARRRLYDRFERQVPVEITDPAERARCADRLLRAHMNGLALKSSKARKARKAAA